MEGLQHLLQSTDGGLDVLREVLLGLLKDKFGDIFANNELCVATVVDPTSSASHTTVKAGSSAKWLMLEYMERYAMTVVDRGLNTTSSGFGCCCANSES